MIIVRLLDKDIKKFDDDIAYLTAVQIVLYQAPRRIMEIVPLAGFIAAFFVLGRMVRSNEFSSNESGGNKRLQHRSPHFDFYALDLWCFCGFL